MSEVLNVTIRPQVIRVQMAAQGAPGPAGPEGPPGSSVEGGFITKLGDGPISGGMVVRYTDAKHVGIASCNNLAHMNTIAGVTLTAVSGAEEEINLVRLGEIVDNAWSWTPGQPIFLSPTGVLTQTLSAAWAFVLVIGSAIASNRIVVDFRVPVIQG